MADLALDIAAASLLTVASLLSQLLSHALKDASGAKKPVLVILILMVVTVAAGIFTVTRLVQKDASYKKSAQDQAALRDTVLLERADNQRFRRDVRTGMEELLARRPDLKRDTDFVRVHEAVTNVRVTSETQVVKKPRP